MKDSEADRLAQDARFHAAIAITYLALAALLGYVSAHWATIRWISAAVVSIISVLFSLSQALEAAENFRAYRKARFEEMDGAIREVLGE